MEPGVREFLLRIVNTIALAIFWMAINSTLGIMYQFGFLDQGIHLGQILFYTWMIVSFVLLFRYLKKLWLKPIDFEDPGYSELDQPQ